MTDRTFLNRDEPGADGSRRKAHYGDGEQPWDAMLRMGIAAQFAAGSILKYLRRTKDPEHSLESARWYYEQLKKLTKPSANFPHRDGLELHDLTNEVETARLVLSDLDRELSADEFIRLGFE